MIVDRRHRGRPTVTFEDGEVERMRRAIAEEVLTELSHAFLGTTPELVSPSSLTEPELMRLLADRYEERARYIRWQGQPAGDNDPPPEAGLGRGQGFVSDWSDAPLKEGLQPVSD